MRGFFFSIYDKRKKKVSPWYLINVAEAKSFGPELFLFFSVLMGVMVWLYYYVNELSSPLCTSVVNVRRILKRSCVCICVCKKVLFWMYYVLRTCTMGPLLNYVISIIIAYINIHIV